MNKINFDFPSFKKWMEDYYLENNRAPDVSELKISNGCPFTKTVVLRNFSSSYTDACRACGIIPRSETPEAVKEQLISELQASVYKNRTTDRDILRKNGLSDRSRYERLFGSWSDALKVAGITAASRYLIKYFDDYCGQDEIPFLKEKLGENGQWTSKQEEYICKMKEFEGNAKLFRTKTTYASVQKNFQYASLVQIAAGYLPDGRFLRSKQIAMDGHSCDSKEEKILDNWLFNNNFFHETHKNYPDSRMVSDFLVDDVFLEYAGFATTNSKSYETKIKRKIALAKNKQLKLIILYDLRAETLERLQAALSANESETDTELTGNPVELSLQTCTSMRYEGYI